MTGSELVSTRRSTVLSLPPQQDFSDMSFDPSRLFQNLSIKYLVSLLLIKKLDH